MSIVRREIPKGPQWKWHWVWRRQIGEYLIVCEWIQTRYTCKGHLNYTIEYRDKSGQELHTEFGQYRPEW